MTWQPVIAARRVYIVSKDTHTLHALDEKSGRPAWIYTAGGRIDSPPTVHGDRVLFGGTDGWVYVDRGRIEASNKDWIREKNDRGPKKAYLSRSHQKNFIEGIKTRKECICPAETGHRSATPGHLGYASLALGRPIKWDPAKEEVVDDPKADKLLKTVQYRGDWKLEA